MVVFCKRAWRNFIQLFSSAKLAVFLLFLMFALTLIGTLYQTDYGLYAAQQRYFYSWFFLLGGFLPFPGALTLLSLFSLNLLVSAFLRYRFKAAKLGIILIHYGIIFLLTGSLYSFYKTEESFISLLEGEETRFSEDYYESELVVWKEKKLDSGEILQKYNSYDLQYLQSDGLNKKAIEFPAFGLRLYPEYYYAHAEPAGFLDEGVESISGARALNYQPLPLKQEQAMPGGVFRLQAQFLQNEMKVLLWEGEGAPFAVVNGSKNETYYLMIRRKRYALPFMVRLKQFTRTTYYDSDIPKEFSSQVDIVKQNTSIPARIFMNNPLRLDGYTFFQASFAIEEGGSKRSIFATVKNSGYYVPYIASLIVTLGILYHFLYMAFARRKRKFAE